MFVASMARLYAGVCGVAYTEQDCSPAFVTSVLLSISVPQWRPSSKVYTVRTYIVAGHVGLGVLSHLLVVLRNWEFPMLLCKRFTCIGNRNWRHWLCTAYFFHGEKICSFHSWILKFKNENIMKNTLYAATNNDTMKINFSYFERKCNPTKVVLTLVLRNKPSLPPPSSPPPFTSLSLHTSTRELKRTWVPRNQRMKSCRLIFSLYVNGSWRRGWLVGIPLLVCAVVVTTRPLTDLTA